MIINIEDLIKSNEISDKVVEHLKKFFEYKKQKQPDRYNWSNIIEDALNDPGTYVYFDTNEQAISLDQDIKVKFWCAYIQDDARCVELDFNLTCGEHDWLIETVFKDELLKRAYD